jgi:hypothetical protein
MTNSNGDASDDVCHRSRIGGGFETFGEPSVSGR